MTTDKELRRYVTPSGKIPFKEWIDNLKDTLGRVRIIKRLDKLEAGHYGDCAPVGDGVQELRLFFGPGYRIYFADYDDFLVILLCGGDKSTQSEDIKKAKMYWKELKERKK